MLDLILIILIIILIGININSYINRINDSLLLRMERETDDSSMTNSILNDTTNQIKAQSRDWSKKIQSKTASLPQLKGKLTQGMTHHSDSFLL